MRATQVAWMNGQISWEAMTELVVVPGSEYPYEEEVDEVLITKLEQLLTASWFCAFFS